MIERKPHPLAALVPALGLLPFGIDYVASTPTPARTGVLAGLAVLGILAGRWTLHFGPREVEGWIDEKRARLAVAALAAIFFVGSSALSLAQHHAFGEPLGQDTAYFTQVIWSASQGEGFRGNVLNDLLYSPPIRSHFGAHNAPFLFLLAPLGWIAPDPRALLVARCLALAVTAFPAFALFRAWMPRPAAVIAVAAVLLQPGLLGGSFHSFYELPFALPLLAGAILFLVRGRPVPYGLCVAGALSVREDVALATAMLAVLALLLRRPWRWPVWTFVASALWFVISYRWVMPWFGQASGSVLTDLFASFGDSPGAILAGMLRRPGLVLAELTSERDLYYVLKLVRSTAGLALLGAASLMAAPGIFFNLMLSGTAFGTLILHYHHSLIPTLGLGLGAGQGIGALTRPLARASGGIARASVLLALAMLVAALAGNLDVTAPETLRRVIPGPGAGAIREALSRIPPDEPAAAPHSVLPHLAPRRQLYEMDEITRYPGDPRPAWALVDEDLDRSRIFRLYRESYLAWIREVLEGPEYELVFERDGIRLYRHTGEVP